MPSQVAVTENRTEAGLPTAPRPTPIATSGAAMNELTAEDGPPRPQP